jgi:hypothetical protein
MPTDACAYFYECENCHSRLKPLEGDCCVFFVVMVRLNVHPFKRGKVVANIPKTHSALLKKKPHGVEIKSNIRTKSMLSTSQKLPLNHFSF